MRWSPLLLFILSAAIVIGATDAQAQHRANISIEEISFLNQPEEPASQTEERLKAEYDNRFRIMKTRQKSEWSFRTHMFVQASSRDEVADEKIFFDPTNVNLEYTKKNFYSQFGFFTLKWEGTDGMNPMDIASIKNWSDPLDTKTRASAGLHFGDSTKFWDWEAAYIPRQTSSQLPGNKSAWWPRTDNLPLRTEDVELRLPDQVDYAVKPRKELNEARDNNFAIRLQTHRNFGDIAIAYYEGAAQTPLVSPVITASPILITPTKTVYQLQSPIELDPTDYRVRSTAAFASTAWESWIFRIASRYDQPLGDAQDLTTWTQQTVAGFEKSSEIFGHSLILIVQGLWFHSPNGGSLMSIQDAFDKSVLLGARWQPSDNWTILLSGIQSTSDSSSYLSGDITKTFESGWSIKGAVQTLEGPKNSLLRVLGDNDRATLELSRAF